MKKLTLLVMMAFTGLIGFSQQEFVYIGGQVTDVNTGAPIGGHTVYAAFNDSLGFYTFTTDMDGHYGDSIYINVQGVSSVDVYTFDCFYMMHLVHVTDLSVPVIVDFSICAEIIPPDCWASFYYYPDSLDFFTWHFVDQSGVPNGTIPDSWYWDFGDGYFSSEQNPTHTYVSEGIYIVCLTITDEETNCENTFCLELLIEGWPSGCENYFTYLTDDGYTFAFSGYVNSSSPVSYFWDFGDGTTGEGQNVTHSYPQDPNITSYYYVCLTTFTIDSINDSCFDVSCQQVLTGGPMDCQAWFYYYPADSLNVGLTYQFIDNSIGIHDNWLWEFGDGTSSTEQNPLHTFADTGTYNVCLSIWDSNGTCESNYCEDVYAGVFPPFDCFNFFNYSLLDTLSVTFAGEAYWGGFMVQADSYLWDFGDGVTGEGQSITHTYQPGGPDYYTVCLTTVVSDPATGQTCEYSGCMDVWLKNWTDCQAMFTYYPVDSANTGSLTYTFYGEAMYGGMVVQADSYLWDFGDGTSGEGQMVTHTFSGDDPMGYMVCLTTITSDPALGDSCYAVSCQEIGSGGSNDMYTLFGQVIMGNAFADVAQVSLYLLAPDGQMFLIGVQPVDSAGHYAFLQVAQGYYYLLAELLPGSSGYGNYLPTYYENAITWTEADMINLGEPSNPYTINLVPVNAYDPGSGTITGTINLNYGLFRDGEPASDVEIVLMNHNDQAILYKYSSNQGLFDFTTLGWGTYKVHAEVPGKITTHAEVILDEENPAGNVEFTITATEVYSSLSVSELHSAILSVGAVYPNPVKDLATLPMTLTETSIVSVSLFNQLGQEVLAFNREYSSGTHLIPLDLGSLQRGIYMLAISTDKTNRILTKLVR